MKKLIFCLMMLGLVYQADAQCNDYTKSKSKKTAVAKKRTATKHTLAKTNKSKSTSVATKKNLGPTLTNSQPTLITNSNRFSRIDVQPLPLRNSVIMQDVRPWTGSAEDLRELRDDYNAVPLPEYRDIAEEEGMGRGEGQIPYRNINMRGTHPKVNSFEEDLEILNRYDKMRGKQVR